MGSPSSGQQVQTTNSTSTTGPSPVIAGNLDQIRGSFWDWYQNHPTAPAFFPGQTFAPMSMQTKAMFDALGARGANGSPLNAAAGGVIGDTLGGKLLDIKNNPYFQESLAVPFRVQAEQFRDIISPAIDSKFAGSGRTGGGAHINTTMKALEDMGRAQADAGAKAAAGVYGNERALMSTAAGMAPGLAAEDYRDIEALGRAGAGLEGWDQKAINEKMARYNYAQNAQPEYLARIAQMLQSIYPGGQTTGNSTTMGTSTPSTNGFDNALGSAERIMKILSMPLSDRRLKSDIQPVGRLNDGQQVYRYRLAGRPHHELGLMAQEVEKRHPRAVATDPLGFKHVDYARATARSVPKGGLM